MKTDNDLEVIEIPSNALTTDELVVLKKMARAYRALGWVLGALLTVSGGALVLYDLFQSISHGGSH